MYFILDDKMVEAERSKYSFLIMLSDIGGFNEAIMFFPAFVMSLYAERMYKKAIAQELVYFKGGPDDFSGYVSVL